MDVRKWSQKIPTHRDTFRPLYDVTARHWLPFRSCRRGPCYQPLAALSLIFVLLGIWCWIMHGTSFWSIAVFGCGCRNVVACGVLWVVVCACMHGLLRVFVSVCRWVCECAGVWVCGCVSVSVGVDVGVGVGAGFVSASMLLLELLFWLYL